MIGAIGINVAHELGHKKEKYKQTMAKALLLPSLYMHFFVEHNLGHHKNVATARDRASALVGENLYVFWFRSVTKSYISAWRIEMKGLRRLGKANTIRTNQMIHFSTLQGLLLLGIGMYFGTKALFWFSLSAIFSFLLLETINYIEHYGLRRKS